MGLVPNDPFRCPLHDEAVQGAIERLASEFSRRAGLTTVSDVVCGCRRDLDTSPVHALPELVERLARQRLLQLIDTVET
ncbi:three-helix bundle dimerization domain-containing protein [Pseudonocardia hispaniensis]|uniref:Three-helix bundle dimerization domain-containing protein n=1 Tax=Pseudonocardia hispaniensis TaxID=904933 RepID=A0ABW1J3C8_9PSEU